MARPSSKTDLLEAASSQYEQLQNLMASLTDIELTSPFDFSGDSKKKEAHWARDKNLRDVLIHLYEWHQLLLKWVAANQGGQSQTFLPAPYNWRTYGQMNMAFWEKHQTTPLEEARALFEESHQAVLDLAASFSNEQLFNKNVFDWVGGTSLGSYFVSATASHYDWAIKKLKAHRKKCGNIIRES